MVIKEGNNSEHFLYLSRDSRYMEQNVDRGGQGKIAKSMVIIREMKN